MPVAEFSLLGRLVLLDLNKNNFREVPLETLQQFINLGSLRLKDNDLATVPRELARLPNLVTLDLRENPVTNIPKEICDLFQNTDNLKLDQEDTCEN